MRSPSRSTWAFVAFTALFAVLATYVFWGTWSPAVTPVMPDDSMWHPLSFGEQFNRWFNQWLKQGKFTPADLLWNGIIVSRYWLQEFKYAASIYLAALGLALFLRGRGLSDVASYGAGTLLGFSGYWFTLFSAGHGGWFILMSTAVAVFAFIDRAVIGGKLRDWIFLGALTVWGSFAAADFWLLITLFAGCYLVFRTLLSARQAEAAERRAFWMRWLRGTGVALVVFTLVGFPSFYDAFVNTKAARDQQIKESQGTALTGGKGKVSDNASPAEKAKADAEARWIFVTNWSLPPEETLEFFIPRLNGDTSCPMTLQLGRAAGRDVRSYTGRLGRPINAPAGNYRQHSLYVGWITMLLALAGAIIGIRRKDPTCLFFLGAAIVFWLFSMGRFCEPVYRLVYMLPFGDYLRAPVKWHHQTELALCVLAGFGLEALFQYVKKTFADVRVAVLIVALVAFFGACDLARIARLYCAPIDISIVKARNPAAELVIRLGKGRVADMIEQSNGLISWSFGANGVSMSRSPAEKGTRFVWATLEQINANPKFAAWLKAQAVPVGYYMITRNAIRSAGENAANAVLFQLKGVPAPVPGPKHPPVRPGILAVGILSFLTTLFACGCVLWKRPRG